MVPHWVEAALWGCLAGAALVAGAAVGYTARVPQRVIAGVMAFGSGVLISALTFELIEKAYHSGGLRATAAGFATGAVVYTVANRLVNARGARHRKRSQRQQPSEADVSGSGKAIALGALLDGIPESLAIGVSMLAGGHASLVTVIAIFLSNVPEGLSSAAGMKRAGRSAAYIFGVWGGIAACSGLAALAGFLAFSDVSPAVTAASTAMAAGAILCMLADTMIPEAYEEVHDLAGLLTVSGFLAVFALSRLFG